MAKEGFVLMARVVGGKQQVQQFPVSRQKFFEGDGWAVHTPEAPAEPPAINDPVAPVLPLEPAAPDTPNTPEAPAEPPAKKEAKQEPKPEPKQPK